MNAQKIVETTGRAVKLEHYIESIKYLYSIRGKCRVHVKIKQLMTSYLRVLRGLLKVEIPSVSAVL